MEVIYTKYLRPEDIIASAMEEDVDVIGISFYTTSPRVVIEKVMTLVNENNMEKTLVTVGGIIPEDDIPKLIEAGAGQAFGPGSLPEDIIKYIQAEVKTRKHP